MYIKLVVKKSELHEFVDYWKKAYGYPNDDEYNRCMNNKPKIVEDIQRLFVWKNGFKLSKLKQKSLDKNIKPKLELINDLVADFNLQRFKDSFKNISTIWKVFLLHVIRPTEYPMLDQYVIRAYEYIIINESNPEMPQTNKQKEDFYFNYYVDFFNDLASKMSKRSTRKHLDEALWAFGKFLKSDYKYLLSK